MSQVKLAHSPIPVLLSGPISSTVPHSVQYSSTQRSKGQTGILQKNQVISPFLNYRNHFKLEHLAFTPLYVAQCCILNADTVDCNMYCTIETIIAIRRNTMRIWKWQCTFFSLFFNKLVNTVYCLCANNIFKILHDLKEFSFFIFFSGQHISSH